MDEVETTVTQKGQVTIPLAVRKQLGIKPRDKVRFEVEGDIVRLRRATSPILAGYGSVKPRRRPEDFRAVREEVEQAIAAAAGATEKA
jgi:AbrB family looped-hinge helix DNA binding protein